MPYDREFGCAPCARGFVDARCGDPCAPGIAPNGHGGALVQPAACAVGSGIDDGCACAPCGEKRSTCCPVKGERCANNRTGLNFIPYPGITNFANREEGEFYYRDPLRYGDWYGDASCGKCRGGKRGKDPCKPDKLPCQKKRCCPPPCPTVCYDCPPKREDCRPQDPKCYKLLYADNFEVFKVGNCPKDDWHFFSDGDGFFANDGKITNKGGGLCLNSKVYTLTVDPEKDDKPGQLDWYKLAIFRDSQFEVPTCGELYGEVCMSAQTFTGNPPAEYLDGAGLGQNIYNPQEDLRSAHARFSFLDTETFMEVGFAVTSKSIYVVHRLAPFNRTDFGGCLGNYTAFSAAYEVQQRCLDEGSSNQSIKKSNILGVGLEKCGRANFYIDGNKVFEIPDITKRPPPAKTLWIFDGEDCCIDVPRCAMVGIGHYSEIDGSQLNQEIILQQTTDQTGLGMLNIPPPAYMNAWQLGDDFLAFDNLMKFEVNDPHADPEKYKIYGQGAISRYRYIHVEYRC